ncbi:M10 family metallopeptidase C-terminal domain-containing protein [Pseudomonas sp. RIT-PI-S]|uniref:M10 family metallopeptidase C-terminal domain-containing protein n=1 Tax=Pseudomonas sp. RIT-PI-S TaxID=3035295 RepID=UPI0021D8A8E1|nr:M10 family metallopeptidase C-terminal domain-containing protein [Pseudomonas sp. RIT-PI-S]
MTEVFDIRDYGAKGNGADDTAAIQKAIDAAAAAGGGKVYVPSGTWVVSDGDGSGNALALKSNVTLSGDGAGATTLKLADGATASTHSLLGVAAGATVQDASVSNLTLDGNQAHASGQINGWSQVGAGTVTNLVIDGVTATHFSGSGFDLTDPAVNLTVRNSTASGNTLDGFSLGGSLPAATFQDNRGVDNGRNGINVNLGGEALTLTDNVASGNGADGIYVHNESGVDTGYFSVIGGDVYDNAGDGVRVRGIEYGGVYRLDIHGNGGSGVDLQGTTHVEVASNVIHGNSQTSDTAEVAIRSLGSNNGSQNFVYDNLITGGANSTWGVAEIPSDTAGVDGSLIFGNVVNGTQLGDINAVGTDTQVTNNSDVLILRGSAAADDIAGSRADELISGGAGNDRIDGASGNDVIVGGAGADQLTGGSGSDVFRFTQVSDSYRTASSSHTDRITDFNDSTDRLDLTALGLVGLGNGHHGTLKVTYNASTDTTYLSSLDADSQGNRFQLALSGNHLTTLGADNFFSLTTGTGHNDRLVGTTADDTLVGNAGRDALLGDGGADRLLGGSGGDTLTGGAGADTFVYTNVSDSYRNDASGSYAQRDLIVDFNSNGHDRIDLTALGFTGLGNGHDGTLKVVLNLAGDYTALKSLDPDANGNRFEILLKGNHLYDLTATNVLFANPDPTHSDSSQPITHLDLAGTSGADTLYGDWGNDTLTGLAGNDTLAGSVGDDLLVGGAGSDRLTGGSGADTFRYNSIGDSFVGSADLITDFSSERDHLDVSALGFTGLGDGTDGTLKVSYNASADRTYIRSNEADTAGHKFQVTLVGDYSHTLTNDQFVFATADHATEVQALGVAAPTDHTA